MLKKIKTNEEMKSIIATALALLLNLNLIAQSKESVFIGTKEVISSKILNENRKVWIYLPNNTSQIKNLSKRYPVMYLLDGEAHFYSTVGTIQQLSQANGNGVLPEMIVVAIENTNRLRDLTPSIDRNNPNSFVGFLSNELIPYIDNNYPTSPYRLLVGHSLGGLTAIDILSNNPALFDAYIAIDPSMWFNNETYLKNTFEQLPKHNMQGKRLFVGLANTLPKGMKFSSLKKDKSTETQHIRSILKFDTYLKTNANGLNYAQKFYENEKHNTVPLLSTYDGLRFIFVYYLLDVSEKDFSDSTDIIALKLKKHYEVVSNKMGFKNSAPESLINYLGYEALTKNHFDKAKALFKLNIEWYPESNNVYDSYADYLVAVKDTSKAIVNYKKALEIKSEASTLSKLNAINKSQNFNYSVDYLKKFAGTYTLVAFNIDMNLIIKDGKLLATVPGQADSEFVPTSENVFSVKGKQGYTITFELLNGKTKGFTSVQPNGTFQAIYKNE